MKISNYELRIKRVRRPILKHTKLRIKRLRIKRDLTVLSLFSFNNKYPSCDNEKWKNREFEIGIPTIGGWGAFEKKYTVFQKKKL